MKKNKQSKTSTDPKKPSIVVQNLTIRPASRQTQDISSWRKALKSAEATNPRRTLLYDLYEDILLDGRLASVVEKRITPITNADWEFVKDGKVITAVNDMIDTPEFEELLEELMSARFWGYMMTETIFDGYRFRLFPVPKKHMRPEEGKIALDQSGEGVIDIRNNHIYKSTVVEAGKPKDLGLLLKAAQYVIYKRGGFGDWAQFSELFGMPFRKATYNGFDDSQRIALEDTLDKMGSAAYAVIPEGSDLEFVENKTNADGSVYNKLIDACDEALSVLILGQTMTTDDGSSRSQGEVHKEVEEGINKADRRWVRRWLNTRFLEVLTANGIDTQGGYFVIKGEDEEKLSKKEMLDMHLKIIKELGLPYDDDHFYEEYGLPKPSDYEARKAEKEKVKEEKKEDPKKDQGKDQGKTDESENLSDKTIWERVKSFFLKAPKSEIGAISFGDHHTSLNLVDTKDYNSDPVIKRFWNAQGSLTFDYATFYYSASLLIKGFTEGWRTKPTNLIDIGFKYDVDDPVALTSYEINLFRFAGAKTLYEARELNKLFRKSKSFDEFYTAANRVLKVHNQQWLNTEYNTAIAVGEASATYQRLLKQVDIFPYWQIKTMRDDRVRDDHRILHDFVARWDDPIWKKLFPPNGYGCRCWIVPRMENEVTDEMLKKSKESAAAYFTTDDWVKSKKAGFGVNRSDLGEVFTANQQYISDMQTGNKLLANLTAADYNKMKLAEAMAKYGKASIDKTKVDADEFFKSKVITDSFELSDYKGRVLKIDKTSFDKLSHEPKFLNELERVIQSPDEVWINAEKPESNINRFAYIKYYKQEPLIVFGELDSIDRFRITDWKVLDSENMRYGLLIKD